MNAILVGLAAILALGLAQNDISGPITQDFQDWLSQNGYAADNFTRTDLGTSGSYGGRTDPSDKVSKKPVIFIHGNSDAALYVSEMAPGWGNSIQYFLDKGYTTQELYATTWGDADACTLGSSIYGPFCGSDSPRLAISRVFDSK